MLNFLKKWQASPRAKQDFNKLLSFAELNSSLASNSTDTKFWLPYRGTMQALNRFLIPHQRLNFINYNLRGIGQVVFVNNPVSGLLILLALFIQSTWVGSMCIIGTIYSTIAAIILGLKQDDIRNGIYGYNGALVGVALAAFGLSAKAKWNVLWMGSVVLFSVLTTVLLKMAGSWWASQFKSPPLTVPFNLMTLLFLSLARLIPAFGFDLTTTVVDTVQSLDAEDLLGAIFIGFGQIFLADKFIVGFLVFLAIAICTPIAAAIALAGSIAGLAMGLLLGAGKEDLALGLWSYNSILSAIAVGGIFYVPNFRSFIIAGVGACLSAIMVQLTTIILGLVGLPILTIPFCLTTIIIFIVLGKSSLLVPVSLHALTNPEEHRLRYLNAQQILRNFRFQLERFMVAQPSYLWYESANSKIQTNLRYIFDAINTRCEKVSIQQVQSYLYESEQLSSTLNLICLVKFIDSENRGDFNYQQFGELVLRHEYLIKNHQSLLNYFLPLDKQPQDFISFAEVSRIFAFVGHTSPSKTQLVLLKIRLGVAKLTWHQFVTVLLVI